MPFVPSSTCLALVNHSLPPDEPLDVAAIRLALGDLARRFDVDVLAECDSTNSRLMALAEAGAASGSVLVAEHQTAGRGRRGRSWLSNSGDSLTFSLLWRFPPDTSLAGLSLAIGVALARELESLGIGEVALKWPNDLLLNGRKLAGILIELVPGPRPQAAVIGVGMNLRLPRAMPEELRRMAAALTEADVILPAANILLARLLATLHEQLQGFSVSGFAGIRAQWLARHAYMGQAVAVISDFAAPIEGLCRGIDDDGALLLETATGVQRIISGEVSLRSVRSP